MTHMSEHLRLYRRMCYDYHDPETSLDSLRQFAQDNDIKCDIAGGVVTFFMTQGEIYVITGRRFGAENSYKLSIGGTAESTDPNIATTIGRERHEEWFGQLSPRFTEFLPSQRPSPIVKMGIKVQDNVEVLKWGPYFTYMMVEHGYTRDELESAVQIMNLNAIAYFPLVALLGHPKFSSDVIATRDRSVTMAMASNILKVFESYANVPGFIPLSEQARVVLECLERGILMEPKCVADAGGFAMYGDKYLYTYTEYSDFRLQTFEELKQATDLWQGDPEVVAACLKFRE